MNSIRIFFIVFLTFVQPLVGRAQIKYDNYVELETSSDFQYKALSLEGQGVLVVESAPGFPSGTTTVKYTLFDNELNVRNKSKVVYDAEVHFNEIEVDSAIAYLFFTNKNGYCQFEKFDLANATSSSFVIDLEREGDLVYTDLSLSQPYILRRHENKSFSLAWFGFESKSHILYEVDCSSFIGEFTVADCKIDETETNYMILLTQDDDKYYEVKCIKVAIETGKLERINVVRKNNNDLSKYSLTDCGFDQDEIFILSNSLGSNGLNLATSYEPSSVSYERYKDDSLIARYNYKTSDMEHFSELVQRISIRGDFQNPAIIAALAPLIGNGKLFIRPNGKHIFLGTIFFNPNLYRLRSSEQYGRSYMMLMRFDEEGNILWDHQLKMEETEYDEKFNDNDFCIIYSDSDSTSYTGILNYQNGEVCFYEFDETGDIYLRNYKQLVVNYFPKNRIRSSKSKVIYLYGKTFLRYGIQEIRNIQRNILQYEYRMILGTFHL